MSPLSPYLTMERPVGVHVVWLVVKDGIEDSESNEIIIELVGAIWVLGEIVASVPQVPSQLQHKLHQGGIAIRDNNNY